MWRLTSDVDAVVEVADGKKRLSCLSELACAGAQSLGLTELSVEDHTMTQRANEEPWPFMFYVTERLRCF